METETRQTSLSPELEEILKTGASTTQQGWVVVSTLLSRSDEKDLNPVISKLLEYVDESDYSLSDWISALIAFEQWLTAKEIPNRPLATMIGYVHCCTLGKSQTLASPELARLVVENLDEWGFDAAQPIDPDVMAED